MDERSTRERIRRRPGPVHRQGHDKASLRELAETMGFTKAALYYHFPSKADILMALHQRMHGSLTTPCSSWVTGRWPLRFTRRSSTPAWHKCRLTRSSSCCTAVDQGALSKLHLEGHEGAHLELEERARRLFGDPGLSTEQRLRMAAAFAVAFITPMLAGSSLPDGGQHSTSVADCLRAVVHQVLYPGEEGRDRAQ